MDGVVLSEFLAHCFSEAVRARQGVDLYSRQVAEQYAQDPVLKDFSVPRFRIPEMEMSIPFVVSETYLTKALRFDMQSEEFVKELGRRADEVVRIRATTRDPFGEREPPHPRRPSAETLEAIRSFYAELNENPSRTEETARIWWPEVLRHALRSADPDGLVTDDDELRQVLATSTYDVVAMVRARTLADRVTIETLVVDPRTNRVMDQTDETSVYTVTAHLVEEGFYLRTIRDDAGNERTIVDFE